MDSFLIKLDEHTDQATRQMLQNLIDKKKKFKRNKDTHYLLIYATAIYGLYVLYLLYSQLIQPYTHSILDVFSNFLANSYLFYVLLCGFILIGSLKISLGKKDKAEKEFHDLRCEIIEKSKDLWKSDGWGQRHKIFAYLKSTYDINLYHVSK